MSLARHHRLRITMGISWRAEYIIGVLGDEGEVKLSYLRHIGLNYDIRALIKSLMDKGLVSMRRPDDKMKLVKLTDYGREYLEQVKELYK
jgi:predicted transcriptional regulator